MSSVREHKFFALLWIIVALTEFFSDGAWEPFLIIAVLYNISAAHLSKGKMDMPVGKLPIPISEEDQQAMNAAVHGDLVQGTGKYSWSRSERGR